jgi:hypothetical protein
VGAGHVLTTHAVNRAAGGSAVIGTGTGDPLLRQRILTVTRGAGRAAAGARSRVISGTIGASGRRHDRAQRAAGRLAWLRSSAGTSCRAGAVPSRPASRPRASDCFSGCVELAALSWWLLAASLTPVCVKCHHASCVIRLPPTAAAWGMGTRAGQAAGAGQPEAGSLRPGHASRAAPPTRSAAITLAACHGRGPGTARGSVTRKAPRGCCRTPWLSARITQHA